MTIPTREAASFAFDPVPPPCVTLDEGGRACRKRDYVTNDGDVLAHTGACSFDPNVGQFPGAGQGMALRVAQDAA